MTIKECYEALGADYEGACQRMLGKEALVARIAKKFIQDPSYQELLDSVQAQDVETAFRAAHTLKGVVMNVGLTNLYEPASALTEYFRAGKLSGCEEMLNALTQEYEKTIAAIRQAD